MAIKFGKKKSRQNNIIYTVISIVLLCVVFLTMVSYLYETAEDEAYENLHIQTKQIKDDIRLQLISDRENLLTMASFASKLYSDGESYDIMFESFKPIGLIENIGILTPDNSFITKVDIINLDGRISFDEEKEKGEYISSRVADLTRVGHEILRSAVPIKANGETVGILYGVIKLESIEKRYKEMAEEFDAQLFVYDKKSGDLIIDTIHNELSNISFLKSRAYNEGFSYEQMAENEDGFTSFMSAYRDEDMHMHYSTIDEFGWKIALARYDSQVFEKMYALSKELLYAFSVMVVIMALYMVVLMANEKKTNSVTACASEVRRTLLETTSQQNNIVEALKQICLFAKSTAAIFFDTDGEDYNYVLPEFEEGILLDSDRSYFISQLFHYASELHKHNKATLGVMCIKPNNHLKKSNPVFYDFLNENKIKEVAFAAVTSKSNHITILGVINSKNSNDARLLAEKIAVCFSIALYNKNHLSRTELAATTDALTGALNRVAYKKDVLLYDEEKSENFSCIYIDVNELHFRNNKYGHAAGDEMLLYIANTLKEVFYGHMIYRMGGDEFLVFCRDTNQETVKNNIEEFIELLKPMDYHVAIGMSYRTQNTNTEEMVREAEIRMYEAKALYYQNKEKRSVSKSDDRGYVQVKTGILEIDTMISVLKEHYNGIYRVSLSDDKAHRILMPAYLGYNEDEEHFSALLNKYIYETVSPEFHRAITSFMNYDALRAHLIEGTVPKITYKKVNGETVILSVYKLDNTDPSSNNTLWVFAKD